jgi:hypothetical protein
MPLILVSGPWVITLAGFRVDGMVGIQGSGWIRLPRRVDTVTAAVGLASLLGLA